MAILSITIPPLGRDVSVRLVRWCKAVGDPVHDQETVGFLQIGSEVFLAEIPSPGSGILTALEASPGDPVRPGQVVGHVNGEAAEPTRPEFVAPLPGPSTTLAEARRVANAANDSGMLASHWQSLGMALVCVLSALFASQRPHAAAFASLSGLGLAYFALSAWATHLRISGQTPGWDLSAMRHRRLWTVLTFIAAASLPVGLAFTEPLASWLAREGRTSADVLKDMLPAIIAVVGCGFFAVGHLKPRNLAIVGLSAVGVALIVLSSTRPLTTEALVMVAAFVTWPVLTFADHDRQIQARREPAAHPLVRPMTPLPTKSLPSKAKSAPLVVLHFR